MPAFAPLYARLMCSFSFQFFYVEKDWPDLCQQASFGYIEMDSIQGVSNAIGLSGSTMMDKVINVQASQAEKNRERAAQRQKKPVATKLYIGNVHPNATAADLEKIFREFGQIDMIELDRDEATLTSRGYAFIQFHDPEGAKRALVGANGYMLAGQALRVGLVNDATKTRPPGSSLDSVNEDSDAGVSLNAQARAALMAKLQRDEPTDPTGVSLAASTCVLLKNMFDRTEAAQPNFEAEMTADVSEEAVKFGELQHVFVDIHSDGFVYLRYSTIAAAARALGALNGRWFAGRQVSAVFVPEVDYNKKFPGWMG